MRIIIKILICLFIFLTFATDVSATEGDLAVDVRSYEGESVVIMDGHPLYSSTPVTFVPQCPDGSVSYSISIDDGESFGGFAPMEEEELTLYPDDGTAPEGRWQIRFLHKAGESETYSCTYRVIFDTKAPVMELTDPETVEQGAGGECSVQFNISDDTGICRTVAKCGDRTISEMHARDDEPLKEYALSVELKDYGEGSDYDIICYDLAGNKTTAHFSYAVDEKAPELTVEGIKDGARTKDAGVIHISAEDDHTGAFISYEITRAVKDEIITTTVSSVADPVTLKFDEDGEYSIVIYATDGAGNRSEEARRSFVIDGTAPEVHIEGVSDNVDLRSAASVAIDVEDNIHEHTKVNISLTRTTLGKTEMIPIDSYELEADHDIRKVDINGDGEYEIRVSATDGAGNSDSVSKRFRIDATAPDISLSGLNEGVVTSQKPVIRFAAGEMFYDCTVMSAILEKKGSSGYETVSAADHVMRSVRDHIDIVPEGEGQYRLTCTAADRSGNSTTSSLCFAVDHTPPVISDLSDIDNKVFRAFSLPKKIAQLVSDASSVRAHAYINDREIGDDDVIMKEGSYVLSVIAEDAADNASESSARFIVDHTAPQIVLSGFDREGNVKKGSLIKVGLLERGDRLLDVRWGGRGVAINDDNTAYIAVNEYGQYRLAVKAEDEAGNVTDTEIAASCYMLGADPDMLTKKLSTAVSAAPTVSGDIDLKGLCVGLLSVLGGTFGLTYRTISNRA